MPAADPVLRNPNLPPVRADRRRARAASTEGLTTPTVPVAQSDLQPVAPQAARDVYADIGDDASDLAYVDESSTPNEPELEPEDPPAPAPLARGNDALAEKLDRALAALDALRAENAQLKSVREPVPAPEPKKARLKIETDPDDPDSDRAADEFLGDHRKTIERIVDKRVAAKVGPILAQVEELISQVEGQLGSVSGATEATMQDAFYAAVKAQHPDFDQLTKQDETFAAYLKEQAPMMRKGVTVGMVLSQAWKDRDLDITCEALERFKSRKRKAAAGRPTPDQFVQPSTPRAGAAPATRQPVRQLKQSDWDALRVKHRKGEISSQEFRQKSAAFLAAAEQGRLINDVAAPSPGNNH